MRFGTSLGEKSKIILSTQAVLYKIVYVLFEYQQWPSSVDLQSKYHHPVLNKISKVESIVVA